MGWDKNTWSLSQIDAIIKTLKHLKTPYKLTVLGKVNATGINDYWEDRKEYKIRKLEYKNIIILEQMHRTSDCDTDDIIESHEFRKEYIPKQWKLEITIQNS